MDESGAHKILSALANGVDPNTGESLEINSPFQALDVIRALFVALSVMEHSRRSRGRKDRSRLPANKGKPWSEEEDRKLLEQFDSGRTIHELALSHDRTLAGIQARLERHGRAQGSVTSWSHRGRESEVGRPPQPGENKQI